jgi:Mn2+/Fe2+ NRAMP family transporter
MDPRVGGGIVEPPTDFLGIVKRLGPGLIIAGSIVGSGELIATTKAGAQAGIAILWLIIIGCVIKVFVQIELGRYTIGHGETTLAALNQVPGPRLRVNWIVWFWLVMILIAFGQLAGIVGGVGQAAALSAPITGDYAEAIQVPSQKEIEQYIQWDDDLNGDRAKFSQLTAKQQQRIRRGQEVLSDKLANLDEKHGDVVAVIRGGGKLNEPRTYDDKIWAILAAVFTAALLYRGRYRMIQNIATVLVVAFTFITVGNVFALQRTEEWHVPLAEFLHGLSFQLPEATEGINPIFTALAAFGIIGVGAGELVQYPYWCLEKGYAKFTGPRTDDENWARRARGWMMVMHYDAFASMIVYTVATLAFFLLGVAVLYSEGRDPDGMRMVSTLASAYVPVFGNYARWLFLIGAVAVLYSTFLVAAASLARVLTDALKVCGWLDRHSQQAHDRSVSAFSVALPLLWGAVYCAGINPVRAVLISGMMHSIMLPVIGTGALYFRYCRTDERLKPGKLWDTLLIISSVGLLIAGGWGVYSASSH